MNSIYSSSSSTTSSTTTTRAQTCPRLPSEQTQNDVRYLDSGHRASSRRSRRCRSGKEVDRSRIPKCVGRETQRRRVPLLQTLAYHVGGREIAVTLLSLFFVLLARRNATIICASLRAGRCLQPAIANHERTELMRTTGDISAVGSRRAPTPFRRRGSKDLINPEYQEYFGVCCRFNGCCRSR